ADVLIHAIIDAIFGAAALGDIGMHFPDTDRKYKGISSIVLLKKTAMLLKISGYAVNNIDATVIAEKPKMSPYIGKMRENISGALDIGLENISIKAKTEEGLG
ncbi:MAG TPA: 2-C-methyl-D-erythritol 2,4-cyclodiphosphate synthase, partial [Clostridiaceae bacterium]|nr:2-C-methyl-D-erythritol 2,4-cyclodiphosphate synthase [Clostridiaceae bacterium]